MKEYKQGVLQFIKFGMVGISNAVISLTLYYFCIYLGFHYFVANTVSWVISVLNAYYWNHRYVFTNCESWVKALIKTYISYGTSYLFTMMALYICIDVVGISNIIAPLLIAAIVTPINFIMNKYWTFRS